MIQLKILIEAILITLLTILLCFIGAYIIAICVSMFALLKFYKFYKNHKNQ